MKSKFEHITPPAGSGLMEIISQYRPHWRYTISGVCLPRVRMCTESS
jgi:hypothetical protein